MMDPWFEVCRPMGRPMGAAMVAIVIAACSAESTVGPMPDPCDQGPLTFTKYDHSVWHEVVSKNVREGSKGGVNTTLVDYKNIRENPERLYTYMRQLCNVDLNSMPLIERLALLANAYNALMIAMVVHFKPAVDVRNIKHLVDSGSVWAEKLWTLGGQKVSLEIIEHDLIRGEKLPSEQRPSVMAGVSGRVHSSIVCGSMSCPALLDVAFTGSNFVSLITENTRRWLRNPTKNPGPMEGGVVLSYIFDWFPGDFVAESGSIAAFLRTYGDWDTTEVPDNVQIAYWPYDWNINALNASGKPISRAVASTSLPYSIMITVLAVLTSDYC